MTEPSKTAQARWEYAVRTDGSLALYRNGATAGFFGRQFGFLRMEHPPAANGVRKGVVVTLLPRETEVVERKWTRR
jgi:hypothetical protein